MSSKSSLSRSLVHWSRRLALLVLPLLAACAQGPQAQPPAAIGFGQFGPISLDVAAIEVVEQYRMPRSKPQVEHLVSVSPAQAVRIWAGDRLRAAGQGGSARVVIKDASIIEIDLPRTQGMKAYFTKDQAQRYDARIEVEVQGQSPRRGFSGFASAVVTRSVTVAEDISVAGREQVWHTLVRQLTEDLNARLDQEIRRDLAAIVLR